jgi:ABC-type glycerol-3-phosphate transport system substrate-binding protein
MDARLRGGRLLSFMLPFAALLMLVIAPLISAQDATEEPTEETASEPVVESVMTRNAEGQTITAWGWDTPEFNRPILDYIQEASGVTVNDVTYTYSDVMENVRIAAAAGVGLPDVFKRGSGDIPALVEIGAIMDITDLVAPYRDMLPEVAWEMVTYQDRIWGVPANSPAGGIFWRYNIAEEYGIDPDSIVTWDDFIAAGEAISTGSNGEVSLFQVPPTGLPLEIIWSIQQGLRAEMIGADGTVKIGPDVPQWQQTLVEWKKVREAPGAIEMDAWTQPWYDAIKNGTIVAFPIGTWFVESIKQQAPDSQGEWYFTPFPAVEEGGDRYPDFGSATAFISSTTQYPEAAMEWVKAWTVDPHGAIEIGLKELGISVVSTAALDNEFVTSPHEYFANDQAYWEAATEAFFNITYVPPSSIHSIEANDIFNRHLEQWWLGNETDEQFLQGVADELRSSLGIQ